MTQPSGQVRNRNFALFLDDSVAAHRRRPAWSPDGLFAVVPGGLYQVPPRPPLATPHCSPRSTPPHRHRHAPGDASALDCGGSGGARA